MESYLSQVYMCKSEYNDLNQFELCSPISHYDPLNLASTAHPLNLMIGKNKICYILTPYNFKDVKANRFTETFLFSRYSFLIISPQSM